MGLNESQKKERSDYLEHNLTITDYSQMKPYVFISYASDDWKTVFETAVVPMQKQYGLRVYADHAFDTVNDEWIIPLLKNISKADIIIAFVSQKYIESYACFLEILIAVNKKKDIVFVSLEDQRKTSSNNEKLNIEPVVKKEILIQGTNITTNTNNTINQMLAMKSAYASIHTFIELNSLSKSDISQAFIIFFDEAPISWKTINNLGKVKGTIENINKNVFDTSQASKLESGAFTDPAEAAYQQRTKQASSAQIEPPKKKKVNLHSKKFKYVITASALLFCLIVGVIIICVNATINVMDMPYLYVTASDEEFESTYTGKWQHNKPNGNGTLVRSDGTVYEGEWKDGQIYYGTQKSANGYVYEGEWKDSKKNGKGTETTVDGNAYVGEFKDNVRNGYGILKYANGDAYHRASYAGDWKDGKKNGQGTFEWTDKGVYNGEFKDDMRNGYGIWTSADKLATYEGEYKNDKMDGQGTYKYSNGNEYTGEWKNNKRDGQGTYKWANGNEYTGEWKDDMQNGYGIFNFANGGEDGKAYYEGEWKDGEMNGQGTLKWNNGNVYIGEFIDGWMNGQGTITFAKEDEYDRSSYNGEWKDGEMNGQGTLNLTNRNVYIGEFVDGWMNGQGTMIYPDGTVQSGTWQDNKFID